MQRHFSRRLAWATAENALARAEAAARASGRPVLKGFRPMTRVSRALERGVAGAVDRGVGGEIADQRG